MPFEFEQRESEARILLLVMPGLVPGIHVLSASEADVDGRDKHGHDDAYSSTSLHRAVLGVRIGIS